MVSLDDIQSWCGATAFQRGKTYYQAGRVTQLHEQDDRYTAIVLGSKRYRVSVLFAEEENDIEAACTCPAYDSYYTNCKHIAAVLFAVFSLNQRGGAATASYRKENDRDLQLSKQMLGIFDRQTERAQEMAYTAGDKQLLQIEYTCKIVALGTRRFVLAVEMKVGPQRLYIVQKIKDFLAKIESRSPYAFSKTYTFDLADQTFGETDWAILQLFMEAQQGEALYRDIQSNYYVHYGLQNDRLLLLPPHIWNRLLPYFAESSVRLEQNALSAGQLLSTDEPIGLVSKLDNTPSKGYQLDIEGLADVIVLKEYGCAVEGCTVHVMDRESLERLSDLKAMLANLSGPHLFISQEQIEPFMERVVPGLKKLGKMEIAKQIASKIVDEPLHIKLYLDRDGDRLLARLEYVYGGTVIDPLSSAKRQEQAERILLRDVERERMFMALLEQSHLSYNGKELHTDDEDAVYHFMHHLIPRLENMAEVFVTSALRSIFQAYPHQPKVQADIDNKTNWLDISFDIEGIDDQQIREVLRSIVEKKKYYRLSDGSFLSLETEGFAQIGGLLQGLDIRKTQIKGSRLELPVIRGFHLLGSEEQGTNIKLGKPLRQLLDNLKHPDNLDFPLPEHLSKVLRDYQKYGFQWMKTLGHYHFGGILADDMGLGKTLQSIAFIQSEQESSRAAGLSTLIVCPASLTFNWRNELIKFAPGLKVVIAVGDREQRSGLLDDLANADVVITSYPLLRRDAEMYARQRFYTLILDEAQAIKNHNTQTAQAVRQIVAHHRFALTGTPVENSLDELWSIYDVVFPELFPSRKAFADLSNEKVAKRIRPFLLRRMKTEVLKELPDKIETLQPTELTTEQKKLYLAYLSTLQKETAAQLQTEGLQKSRMKILAGILRLRQLCCHPSLFVENYSGGSGKLEQLLEIVDECLSGGKRMLIFSQFTGMLGILRRELEQRDLSSFYLDGKTPPSERVELCDRFNDGEQNIFLISLKAGGTGLNLTGADTVLLYDLWWNPAVEQQATDRAHRIGQKKVVQVIRLLTQGTIEEKIYELQQRKKDLISQVIQPGDESLSALTEQEIRELLMIG
ncbi:MAG: DEAD/DEAH box helicase [Bacilli bacterium]